MSKLTNNRAFILLVYGLPGAGKTFFARQMAANLGIAHLQAARIRHELFKSPRYDDRENAVVNHLMDYMLGEFLSVGTSVVYDGDSMRRARRRHLRSITDRCGATLITVWLQIDLESAFNRVKNRDRRKVDDKFEPSMDRPTFENYINLVQNPSNEDYVVISGKHSFATQRAAALKKLYAHGLVNADAVTSKLVKPQLVNRIPNLRSGRVDESRRGIFIR